MPDTTQPAPKDAVGAPGSLAGFTRRPEDARMSDNLPLERTSFVGRERELAEVKRLLSDRRLLTLCGPGGAGKTRLALAVARDVAGEFERGAWWVELAPVSDPALVPAAVAQAVGAREAPDLSPTEALVGHLKGRKVLAILDNCEHVVEACADLADALLGGCPDLKILATSREPLRVAGETNFMVPSLSVPNAGSSPTTEELAEYEAVRLFVERAGETGSGFALTEPNAPAVAQLCDKLDGIPLAIELAAARTRVLTVEQISEKLDDPLGLLTKGSRTAAARHRTLRATFGWSYGLLDEPERELFRRLSVFVGGFTLEAAESVGSGKGVDERDVLDLLSGLVDKSLVVAEAEAGGAVRYGMLEPIRQYALECLAEDGQAEMVRLRHAAFFLELAERAHPQLVGPHQIDWLERLEREIDNLRTAARSLMEEGEVETAVRLAWALHLFWSMRAYQREGYGYVEEALEKGSALSTSMRAKAHYVKATMSYGLDEPKHTSHLFEASAALFRQAEDKSGLAGALGGAGFMALQQGEVAQAMAFNEESLALYRGLEDKRGISETLVRLGMVLLECGDKTQAMRHFEEVLALAREVGSRHSEYGSLYNLALMARVRGEHERALHLYAEGLKLAAEVGDKADIAYCLERLAELAASKDEPERAARLFGASEALVSAIGLRGHPYYQMFDRALYERVKAEVMSELGEATFEAALDEGRAMPAERAVEYAIEEPTTHDASDEPPRPRGKDASASSAEAPFLRILALGQARVEKDGRPLDSADWTQKPKELLFYLLTHPPRTKEQIGLALWPEASTSRLRGSFHDAVYRLRRALGGKEWIAFGKGRYYFDRSLGYSFDVETFEENLSEAHRLKVEAPERAVEHLREAAGLYGGDFLEDLVDSEWALEHQDGLRRAYGEALLLLGGLLVARGRHVEAAQAYRKAISHERFLEEAHRGLMRSQVAMGERGQALRHYEGLVGLLEVELGSLPAPETSALYELVRAGQDI